MYKRGQIFLIAAFIIIGLLVGLAAIYTTTLSPKEDVAVYDLSGEINYEASRVIDNGVVTGNLESKLKNLTDFYAKSNPESDFVIVYGNSSSLKAIYYEQTELGSIGIGAGGQPSTQTISQRTSKEESLYAEEGKVMVEFGGNSYDFDLKEGQSFYLVIKKEQADEEFVAAQ